MFGVERRRAGLSLTIFINACYKKAVLKMFLLFTWILLVITMARARVVVLDDVQQKPDEKMCGPIVEMLCVKDALFNLVRASKDVDKLAAQIEKETLERESTASSVIKRINELTVMIRPSLPTSRYHNRSSTMNNLNKDDLIRVFREENDAVNYLYNSIRYVRQMENYFVKTVDNLYDNVEQILRNQFLCAYRNILHVYSERWEPSSPVHRIPFSNIHIRESPSFAYSTHAVFLARILRGWMETIENFMLNLETKLI